MVRVLIVIALAACTRTSEKYCGLHPEDLAHCPPSDAPVDPRQVCAGDPECPAVTPHCLIEGMAPTGFCVGCITSTDCTQPGRAACDPDTRTCRSCVEHADCTTSNACLPDGTCGTDDNVIYVDELGTDAGDCTVAAKCKTILFALEQVTAERYHIKLSGTLRETVTVAKRVVFIADPATKLVGLASPALKIQKSTVHVNDLEIACETAINGLKSEMESTSVLRNVYIHGCALGIENKGGFLNITRSRIAENTSGGITLDAASAFSITNTFLYRNGSDASALGAVAMAATTTGMNRFEHNTVADNTAKVGAGAAGGVKCTLTNFTELANNIIAGNTPANTFGCDPARSKIEVDSTPLMFVSPATAPYDYHLLPGSPAIDQIDQSGLSEDFDGQFRPQGPRKDFGADEYKP